MKKFLYLTILFVVILEFACGNNLNHVYGEVPIIPTENNSNAYLSQIVEVPPVDDPRWELVPKEEMAKQLQFLVDQQNSNYERIRTWTGSYYQIVKVDMTWLSNPSAQHPSANVNRDIPASVIFEDLFTFSCNVKKDQSFLRLDRLYEQYYDKNGAEREKSDSVAVNSNICSILTKDQYWQYEFDSDQMRGELAGVMPERLGKVCETMPADEQRGISRMGTLFDPRLFFYTDLEKKFEAKAWHNIEEGFVRWLRGELSEEMRQRALDRLTVLRGEFDSVVWYRVVYHEENGSIRDEYVFNSDSNFNMVLSRECNDGVPFMTVATKYRADGDIYVPEQCVLISGKGDSFRYFKHIESALNEKIPSDQFTIKALGLEDGTVVLDKAKEVSYEYVNGQLKPIAKFGATESYSGDYSFWRSPARIVAFVLGAALIAFGVVRRFRKRPARS